MLDVHHISNLHFVLWQYESAAEEFFHHRMLQPDAISRDRSKLPGPLNWQEHKNTSQCHQTRVCTRLAMHYYNLENVCTDVILDLTLCDLSLLLYFTSDGNVCIRYKVAFGDHLISILKYSAYFIYL